MFLKHAQIAPDQMAGILNAAEAALRAVPPSFSLDATVAVNPFQAQSSEDLAQAQARLARVAGVRLTPPRAQRHQAWIEGRISDDDLAAALIACRAPMKPVDLAALKARMSEDSPPSRALPTLADLAAAATGTDWPALIQRTFGLWAAGHFDQGQALWTGSSVDGTGGGAWTAWRAWAMHDLTPEIAGLTGFCAHVAAAPDTAERAILRAADRLGLDGVSGETAFHRLLIDLGGWAQHARGLLFRAEVQGGSDSTLADLLAIRLIWEEALIAHLPALRESWAAVVAEHAAPVQPGPQDVVDAILQDAAERAHQRGLMAQLAGTPAEPLPLRPAVQAVFCIDVRSEPFRRALESQDQGIATLGFAGFFGLPIRHHGPGSDLAEARLPVLLAPKVQAVSALPAAQDQALRISARARRAWGRFRQAAVSSFAFVEAAGPAYAAKLVKDALHQTHAEPAPTPAPGLPDLGPAERAALAAGVLKAMGLATGAGRLLVLVGHGAGMCNNPHDSAYQCGACGGHAGDVSARALARLLNDPATRAGLAAEGVDLPADTHVLAGLHDTVTDQVRLYDGDDPAPDHARDIARLQGWLAAAGRIARAERAPRLPGARAETLERRAHDWAELRPEWGLAGCAAFIAAPRAATAGVDLGGRAFLHSYDWRADPGFAVLETILTAPVVVASWISLQYYGSTLAPDVFGGGNKLIHNVVGGIGVVEGNGGVLRTGLPWQAVHDGAAPAHDPLRLTVLVQAPQPAVTAVLERHPALRRLFDHGWLHLMLLEDGRITARYRPGLHWDRP